MSGRARRKAGVRAGGGGRFSFLAWTIPLALGALFVVVLLGVGRVPGVFQQEDRTVARSPEDLPDASPPGSNQARVAIVIQGLGDEIEPVDKLLQTQLQVSLAVLPYRRYSQDVALRAHRRGKDVLLHLPLEPVGFPSISPGSGCLLVSMDRAGIQRELADQIASLPACVGVSPYMGSRFLGMREPLGFLAAFMKERGLFLVDNRSAPGSGFVEAAKAYGIPFVQGTHILDEQRDEAAVIRELCRLADFAARNGWALGIGHPYPETLSALPRVQAAFREKNVALVPVSGLIPPAREAAVRAAFALP